MKLRHILFSVILSLAAGSAGAQGFVFKDMQGQTQRLSDYRGKWVLVNFWATWCPPCLEEIPDLIALHEAHRKTNLVVIGVALDSDRDSVVEFVAKKRVSYPVDIVPLRSGGQAGELSAGDADARERRVLHQEQEREIETSWCCAGFCREAFSSACARPP